MTQSVTELVTGGEFGLVLVILVLFIAFQVWLRVSQYFARRRRSNAEQVCFFFLVTPPPARLRGSVDPPLQWV